MQNYPPQVRTPEAHTRSQLSDRGAAYANSTMDIIPDSSASVNAPSDDLIRMAPSIYRSGSPLFAGMDEAELTSEIAREGRMFFAVTYVLYLNSFQIYLQNSVLRHGQKALLAQLVKKFFLTSVDGGEAPPPLPPLHSFH